MSSKRDFGSFHSSNVQELLEIPEADYIPPTIPIQGPSFAEYEASCFQFGIAAKEKHFFLEKECTFLNHGAFGAVLKEALISAQAWQNYIERQPTRFMDRELIPHLVFVGRRMAKFVGCSVTDLVLVSNVTTALNSVLRSVGLKPGDIVFQLSIEYGATKKIISQVCHDTGADIFEQELLMPIKNKQQILDTVMNNLPSNTKLAVFDHIPSNTPFIMPIQELTEICHQRNIQVLIDGAHALGQLDLNISSIGADYYTTNCHKWFSAPKGAALLYVDKKYQAATHPLLVSHGHGFGFNSEFIWQGLKDYSSMLALHTVLDFWESVGPATIRKYMYNLTKDAKQLLCETWQTRGLAPAEMTGAITCIQLPEALHKNYSVVNYHMAEIVQNHLFQKFNIEVPIKAVQNKMFVRISVHIHNTIDDYRTLADAVQEMVDEHFNETMFDLLGS